MAGEMRGWPGIFVPEKYCNGLAPIRTSLLWTVMKWELLYKSPVDAFRASNEMSAEDHASLSTTASSRPLSSFVLFPRKSTWVGNIYYGFMTGDIKFNVGDNN